MMKISEKQQPQPVEDKQEQGLPHSANFSDLKSKDHQADNALTSALKAARMVSRSLASATAETDISASIKEPLDTKDDLRNIPSLEWMGRKLVGRENESRLLSGAINRSLRNQRNTEQALANELIIVSGSPGIGKTSLVLSLRDAVPNSRFVYSKFDQLQRPELYTAWVAVTTSLLVQLQEQDRPALDMAKSKIEDAFKAECDTKDLDTILTMMPEAAKIIRKKYTRSENCASGSKLKSSSMLDKQSRQRLPQAFVKMLRACCSHQNPLVIVLDDFHWADRASLEVLETLIVNSRWGGLAVVAICRCNEVPFDHPLSMLLRQLEDQEKVNIQNVLVGCHSKDNTLDLVSSILQLPRGNMMCNGVSKIIHEKTNGNPLYTIEFLKGMVDSGVLQESQETKWCFYADEWAQQSSSDFLRESSDVTDLFLNRIRLLSADCQALLATAACLGSKFEKRVLAKVLTQIDLDEALSVCTLKGLLTDQNDDGYQFYHDRIQQAAYRLVPEKKCPSVHLDLGRTLLKTLSKDELSSYKFVVTDQLVRGSALVTDRDELREMVILCLGCGSTCAYSSDYSTALAYFQQGYDLLDARRKWVDDYQLTLDISNAMAETYFCLADFEKMNILADAIFLNARQFQDKLRAYMLRICSLGSSMTRQHEAIRLGIAVLRELGECIPKQRTLLSLIPKYLIVQRKLRGKTDRDLIHLPDCTDPTKLAVMGILNLMSTYAYTIDQSLFPFLALRMVSISLKYGLSAVSVAAFSYFGLLMCGVGDFEGGKRYGRVALSLLDRYESVRGEWLPRCYTVYATIALWTTPFRECFDFMEEANRVGLERDLEFASFSHYLYGAHLFFVGESFDVLEPLLRSSITKMRQFRQDGLAETALLYLEPTLILMGRNDDPLVLNGALFNPNPKQSRKLLAVKKVANMNFSAYLCMVRVQGMTVHYHLGNLSNALAMGEQSTNAFTELPAAQLGPAQSFYHGLAAVAVLREYRFLLSALKRRRLLSTVKKSLKLFQKFTKLCPTNFEARAVLLQAELAAYEEDYEAAAKLYSRAEMLAKQEKYLDVQGIACERAGLTLREIGFQDFDAQSQACLTRAADVYKQWGALAVVKRVQQYIHVN